jgi:hypothetical protein
MAAISVQLEPKSRAELDPAEVAVNKAKALESRSHRFCVAPMMDRYDYQYMARSYVVVGAARGAPGRAAP